jgi:hypothetical protein
MKFSIGGIAMVVVFLSACQKPLSKRVQQRREMDSLLQDAKWEIYKLNLCNSSTLESGYVPYQDSVLLVLNCNLAVRFLKTYGDTTVFYMEYFLSNKKPIIQEFLPRNTDLNKYHTIGYAAQKKAFVGFDDGVIMEYEHRKNLDSCFTQWIEAHRQVITNQWLLNYYDVLQRKKGFNE